MGFTELIFAFLFGTAFFAFFLSFKMRVSDLAIMVGIGLTVLLGFVLLLFSGGGGDGLAVMFAIPYAFSICLGGVIGCVLKRLLKG